MASSVVYLSPKPKKASALEIGVYAALCVGAAVTAYVLHTSTPQRPSLENVEVMRAGDPEKAPAKKSATESLHERLR